MTCFGINNEGQLVFDYYHEDTDTVDGANVYNGQNSTLWCNFREAFADEIKETYQQLRGDGLITYDMLEEQFITKGSDKWSESVFNEDGEFKYVSMVKSDNDASNLPFARGDGEQHLRYFVENRLNYCDSKWYATDYANDFISLRIYTPSEWTGVEPNADITVVPYSNMYAGVRYKANGTLYQEKVEHGESITFEAPDETFNDTETAVYGASQLSSLGDLAPLYCGTVNVAKATKLTEIKIGDGTEGYSNNNLKELSVGTNKLLKKIDIQNCPSFTSALGLSGCQNIEEIYAKGSGITGVELADSGYLKIVQLPGTIANLTMKNQEYIEEFSMEGYSALKTLHVENCPAVNTLDIIDKATNLERVRVTGVNWNYPDTSFLYELMDRKLAGIDENGTNTDTMWVDGKCHIESLTGAQMAEIKAMYPYLEITYDTLTSQLIYMSEDGSKELYKETIVNGGNGAINILHDHDNLIDLSECVNDENMPDGVSLSAMSMIATPFVEITPATYYTNIVTSLPSGGSAWHQKVYVYDSSKTFIKSFMFYDGVNGVNTIDLTDPTYKYVRVIFSPEWTNPYFGPSIDNMNGIPVPTKESTAQYDFTFNGWSLTPGGAANDNALLRVEADRYVYAAFANELRYYTVNFYIDGVVKETYSIGYGHDATFAGSTVHPTDPDIYEFVEWKPSPANITGDTNCYAQYYDKREIQDDWATIAANCYNGTATSKYAIGVYKNVEINYEDGTSETIPMEVIAHNHDELSAGHFKWEQIDIAIPFDINGSLPIIEYRNALHVFVGNIHYRYDGKTWNKNNSTLPYDLTNSKVVLYNDEVHVLGGTNGATNHYKFYGSNWTNVSTLPAEFNSLKAVVCNNAIHIIGDNGHYKWNGSVWTSLSIPTFTFGGGIFLTYNDEIYVLGGNYSDTSKNMYKYDTTNDTWVKGVEMPRKTYMNFAVAYNGKIHVLGDALDSKAYYTWNGTEWSEITYLNIPTLRGMGFVFNNEINIISQAKVHWKLSTDNWVYKIGIPTYQGGSAVVYKNQLHYLGGWNGKTSHHVYDGTTCTKLDTPIPFDCIDAQLMVLNDEMHVIVDSNHYKYDGSVWSNVSTPPETSVRAVVYNNEIHAFKTKNHYKWNGTEWLTVGSIPESFSSSRLVVYNNELHAIGGNNSKRHYKYNGTEWTNDINLPKNALHPASVVYNDTLYLLGCVNNNPTNSNEKGYENYMFKYTEDGWVHVGWCPYIGQANTFTKAIVFRGRIYALTGFGAYYIYQNTKATLTFFAKNATQRTLDMRSSINATSTSGGWELCKGRIYLNETLYPALDEGLKTAIKPVIKLSDKGHADRTTYVKTNDYLWLLSSSEVGHNITTVLPGCGEQYPVFTTVGTVQRTQVGSTNKVYYPFRTTVSNVNYAWDGTTPWGFGRNGTTSANINICFGFCI